jgi:hypothetical protein
LISCTSLPIKARFLRWKSLFLMVHSLLRLLSLEASRFLLISPTIWIRSLIIPFLFRL